MQLSVSSGKYGIVQRATFLIFGDSLDHTTDYPLADIIAAANRWRQIVASWIWRASGEWEFDDANYTDLPIATTTLVAAQQDYSLPTTAFQIHRVEVLNSSGDYLRLKQIDQTEVKRALTEFESTNGLPKYYDVIGNSLFLYPAPAAAQVTLALGLKLYFARETSVFAVPATYTTADATEPGFDEPFHDIICYGVAHDYLEANEKTEKAKDYQNNIAILRADLEAHYGNKNKDKKVAIKPKVEKYQ